MTESNLLDLNRVILCHFDSYSTALTFARFGVSVLAPSPLSESATPIAAPAAPSPEYAGEKALLEVAQCYNLDASQLNLEDRFQVWMSGDAQPVRIHLARFTCFQAPREALEPHGANFRSISEMRGTPMIELNMLRQIFNLIMGG